MISTRFALSSTFWGVERWNRKKLIYQTQYYCIYTYLMVKHSILFCWYRYGLDKYHYPANRSIILIFLHELAVHSIYANWRGAIDTTGAVYTTENVWNMFRSIISMFLMKKIFWNIPLLTSIQCLTLMVSDWNYLKNLKFAMSNPSSILNKILTHTQSRYINQIYIFRIVIHYK